MSNSCAPTRKLNVNFNNINQEDCDPDISCFPSTNGEPSDSPPVPSNDILRRDPTTKFLWMYTCDGGWECFAPAVDCILSTDGKPVDVPPTPKNSTIRHDPCTGELWLYKCDGGWKELELSLCGLSELDTSAINDICDTLKIPLFYDVNGCCTQGYNSINQFVQVLLQCIDVCDLLAQVPDNGSTSSPDFGGSFSVMDGCEIRQITLPSPDNICTSIKGLPDGSNISLAEGGSFDIIDPSSATCEIRTVVLPSSSCCPA